MSESLSEIELDVNKLVSCDVNYLNKWIQFETIDSGGLFEWIWA